MKVHVELIKNLDLPFTGQGRSVGVHVSGIIKCIAGEAGILKPEYCEELELIPVVDINTIPMRNKLMIHMGLAWEQYYAPLLPDVADHPGEMQVDNVYMTHDGESVDLYRFNYEIYQWYKSVYHTRIHEFKFTYKSTKTVGRLDNTGTKSAFMWLAQMKAYCHGRGCTDATLHVMFPCGDYKRPIAPQLRRYYIEFEQSEILDNWRLLMDYRQYRMDLAAAPKEIVNFGEWNGIPDDQEETA